MKQIKLLVLCIFLILLSLNLGSGVVVKADYITIFSGEQGIVRIEVENNENFDIENVRMSLVLDGLPFTTIGSSEKDLDDLDEDDKDSVSFTLRPSTGINPGDYNIPYSIKFLNADQSNNITLEKKGGFGLRVGAKTELDFSVEANEKAIVGKEGRISLEIINKGLGEIKSVSVQIFPQGFELLSKDKIFIGTIDPDDTDIASFDVLYKTSSPRLSAKIEYKDFDNIDQISTVNFPIKVYTSEEALRLGLIEESNTGIYIGIAIGLIIVWFIYRKIKKRKKDKRSK